MPRRRTAGAYHNTYLKQKNKEVWHSFFVIINIIMNTLKLSSADHNRDSISTYCKVIPNTKDEVYVVAMYECNNDVKLLNFTAKAFAHYVKNNFNQIEQKQNAFRIITDFF